jgi:hypothetical protein
VAYWHQYLRNYLFAEMVALPAIYDPLQKTLHVVIYDSLERVVGTAHRSVCDDKINPFD